VLGSIKVGISGSDWPRWGQMDDNWPASEASMYQYLATIARSTCSFGTTWNVFARKKERAMSNCYHNLFV